MASEPYKCKGELAITDIEKDEEKHNECGTYFVDNHNILNSEIKEEAKECKPFEEYGVSNECLEKNGNVKINDPNSSEFEVMLSDPTESKFSPVDFWENMNFDGVAGELAKSKVSHFNDGVMLKNGDHSECYDDESLANYAQSKTETIKIENDIDIIYNDVKLEICEEKSNGKSQNGSYLNVTDILIGTEIGANFSKDSETWPQQNLEEDGTAVEKDNDIRKRTIFQCRVCLKSFKKRRSLLDHERIHTGEKPYQCKVCSESFAVKRKLVHHERIHTGENPFQCKICLKSFYQKGNLKKHDRIHTGEKLFQCKICLESFAEKSKLLEHERTHTGSKPFQCRVCSKSFNRKYYLKKHERIHTGVKPIQCKFCPKSFAAKNNAFLYHERIHTGEKPFQCKVCLKSFAAKQTLLTHDRIHTGEKPFHCRVCAKSFADKSTFLRHERIHTNKKPL